MKHYLVIRTSAMGDVALTVPVIKAVIEQNPEVQLHIVTPKLFHDFYDSIPRITLHAPDFKGKHKGILGLRTLFKDITAANEIEAVIDLHGVLRSYVLGLFAISSGLSVHRIKKYRKSRKKHTRKRNKVRLRIPHVTRLYARVFRRAGLSVTQRHFDFRQQHFTLKPEIATQLKSLPESLIGIAPFAQHKEKIYPLEKMKKVIEELTNDGHGIVLFGGGMRDQEWCEAIAKESPNVLNTIGRYRMEDELALITQMHVMLTMDSSNMHLAALTGTPVVSIWGSTHPALGYAPFMQPTPTQFVQIPVEELPCRPCSVYGNKPCHRGDLKCLQAIEPTTVCNKIKEVISKRA